MPFSQKTRDYIASLDVERDLSLLAAHGLALRAECTRVFRASSLLLQKAAARGMTPYAIASIMCRDAVSKSWVERLHSHVLQVGSGWPTCRGALRSSLLGKRQFGSGG